MTLWVPSLALAYVLFMPLAFALALTWGGNSLAPRALWVGCLGANGLSLVAQLTLLATLQGSGPGALLALDYGLWFTLGLSPVTLSFVLDGQGLLMTQLVTLVSAVTQVYSFYYLAEDPSLARFQSYLQFFTFFMLMLVNADNLVLFFLGWEGVGLCSYLLIGFWHSRPQARAAAIKAVALNRLGDSAYLLGAALLYTAAGSLDFAVLAALLPSLASLPLELGSGLSLPLAEGAALCFALAAAAKSAQLGFHGWLADAMEGPTPVSALIHAATMVTAGVYLVLRLSFLFAAAPLASAFLAVLGATTALFGASTAVAQCDVKKMIAYSTCSQLGYMFCAAGCGGYALAFHHLIFHGYFKALLFLSAGVLIHNLAGEQDMRFMGGLGGHLPLTASYFAVGSASLVGLPGTAGFASKESILDLVATLPGPLASLCLALMLLALVCTALYSLRSFALIFGGDYRGPRPVLRALGSRSEELPLFVVLALLPLVLLALAGDGFLGHYFSGGSHSFWAPAAASLATTPAALAAESLATGARLLPTLGMLGALLITLAWPVLPSLAPAPGRARSLQNFLARGWLVDGALMALFAGAFGPLCRALYALERLAGEVLAPAALVALVQRSRGALLALAAGRPLGSLISSLALAVLVYLLLAIALEVTGPGASLALLPLLTPAGQGE